MGDRCSVTLTFLREDSNKVDKMCELNYAMDNSENEYGAVRTYTWDEANYAFCAELQVLAGKKLSFYGSHDAGGSYGPEEFVCYRGDYVGIDVGYEGPVVSVSPKGVPDKAGVARIKKYRRLLRMVEREFKRARRQNGEVG